MPVQLPFSPAILFDTSFGAAQFEVLALDLFRYQAAHNEVYRQYISLLGVDPSAVCTLIDIPFLPVELFKQWRIVTGTLPIEYVFTSSGTTGSITSSHYVADLSLYRQSYTRCFELFYGSVARYAVLALLPAYLERSGSSLVYMAQDIITQSQHPESGFYRYDHARLAGMLQALSAKKQATLLLGVTFGLLDFAESYPQPLPHTIIMETGGMKGRRREMVRPEVHDILQKAFGASAIHSEYGMTELLSQAYSEGNGLFRCPPWMRILLRDPYVPTHTLLPPTIEQVSIAGAINVIDLANIHSCAFIATADLARQYADGCFEVLGRMDNSDIRGCNLLVI